MIGLGIFFVELSGLKYGLVASQLGDIEDTLTDSFPLTKLYVKEFGRGYFDFNRDRLGLVAGILIGFNLLFAFIFAFSIKLFNSRKDEDRCKTILLYHYCGKIVSVSELLLRTTDAQE